MFDFVRVADIDVQAPFIIIDSDSGNVLHSMLDSSQPGDIPFDIALRQVLSVVPFNGGSVIVTVKE